MVEEKNKTKYHTINLTHAITPIRTRRALTQNDQTFSQKNCKFTDWYKRTAVNT